MRRRWKPLTALIIATTITACAPPPQPVADVPRLPVAQVDGPTRWTGEADLERDRRERLAERIRQAELQAELQAERVRQAERAARQAERTPPPPTAPPSTLPSGLLAVRAHESGGDYAAYNPTGCSDANGTWSCGGAFQLSEQYASEWAARSGFEGMSSQAQTWPPAIQDAVAVDLWYASNPDGTTWCSFTTYC